MLVFPGFIFGLNSPHTQWNGVLKNSKSLLKNRVNKKKELSRDMYHKNISQSVNEGCALDVCWDT